MSQDFKELLQLPPWLKRPAHIAQASHQLTLLARALGGIFNGLLTIIYNIRRAWIVSTSWGVFLVEHGADRNVFKRDGETEADFKVRVLAALRAKKPGETKAGMRTALDTLGLADYEIHELYRLEVEDPADPRWDEFEIRYPNTGNEGITDEEIQARIDKAKPPRARGIAVRYAGATVDGFGSAFGTDFGS